MSDTRSLGDDYRCDLVCSFDGERIVQSLGVWQLCDVSDKPVDFFHGKAEAEKWATERLHIDDFDAWLLERNKRAMAEYQGFLKDSADSRNDG